MDVIHDRKGIYEVVHTVLQSFMITTRARLKKYCSLNLELADEKSFDNFLWGDNFKFSNFQILKANFNCVFIGLSNVKCKCILNVLAHHLSPEFYCFYYFLLFHHFIGLSYVCFNHTCLILGLLDLSTTRTN